MSQRSARQFLDSGQLRGRPSGSPTVAAAVPASRLDVYRVPAAGRLKNVTQRRRGCLREADGGVRPVRLGSAGVVAVTVSAGNGGEMPGSRFSTALIAIRTAGRSKGCEVCGSSSVRRARHSRERNRQSRFVVVPCATCQVASHPGADMLRLRSRRSQRGAEGSPCAVEKSIEQQ